MQKGTVTPLSRLLPVHDVNRAVQHFHDAIREKIDQQLETKRFAEENKSLQKLVQELPHRVSHKIMVPFGSAAFFPGELVHTNEMMVFLGEGYYAEQSAKQTLEKLKRRGKYLDSMIEALTSEISDLQTQAFYASEAATEAAGGFVEIREEYIEPTDQMKASQAIPEVGQEENDHIFARLAQLEQDEEDADVNDDDEDESGAPSVAEEDVPKDVPVVRSPADLIQLEDWKTEKLEREKKKKVSFNLTPEERIITPEPETPVREVFNREKAFTGSVVEHVETIEPEDQMRKKASGGTSETNAAEKVNEAYTEKPMSRFRMQRLRRGE